VSSLDLGEVLLRELSEIETQAARVKRDPTPAEYRRLIKAWSLEATAYSNGIADEAADRARAEVLALSRHWRAIAALILLLAGAIAVVTLFGLRFG
jgi:hypothetical protein